ncbi:hypothetical protein ACFWHQ_24915, partial [Streptomyces sp. NPDC060334]
PRKGPPSSTFAEAADIGVIAVGTPPPAAQALAPEGNADRMACVLGGTGVRNRVEAAIAAYEAGLTGRDG